MYAYVKNGVLDSYSEEFFAPTIPAQEITVTLETEDGTKTEKTETVPEVPGLVYDEVIEYEFEEIPVLEDGQIVPYSESRKKTEDDAEAERKRAESVKARKAEILAEAGRLDSERSGLLALGGSKDDPEITEIEAKISALRTEYESLNA